MSFGDDVRRVVLLALATASGAASLTYQIVWMRRLALVFGSTTLATSTVLAAFLGGLAIGAWLFGLVADHAPRSSLAVFGLVEAATGGYALASPVLFGAADAVYRSAFGVLGGRPAAFLGLQFLLSALVIVPPAILMGGSLPLVARRMVSGRRPMAVDPVTATAGGNATSHVAALYGWNTLGAALGAALATYGLLPSLGLSAAVALAAAVNLTVGAAALLIDARSRREATAASSQDHRHSLRPVAPSPTPAGRSASAEPMDPVTVILLLQAFALSGFAAIAYEVTWARLLALIIGSSVYAFGTLVVCVLGGLGLGSALYSRLRLGTRGHLLAFAVLEGLVALAGAASLIFAAQLPYLFMRFFPVFKDAFSWLVAAYAAATAMIALVPALLLGATFPAVVGALGSREARLGRSIGVAYGANTVGTVLGAFLAGFVLIPALGLRPTVAIAVLANVAAASAVALRLRGLRRQSLTVLVPVAAALAVLLSLPPWPREVLASGVGFYASRFPTTEEMARLVEQTRLLYYKDGLNTTISVDRTGDELHYRSNGKTDASTHPNDMRVQLLLGHVPMLRHLAPADIFVLGLGTGATAAAVSRYPIRRIDLVELEPAAVEAAQFFEPQNLGVLRDPRLRLILADGRQRLRAAPDRYDIIISDPSDLWVAGIGSLYTTEFYRLVRERLRPGGILVQWVHTHALAPDDLRSLLATFWRVFPDVEVWAPAQGDLMLVGTAGAPAWDYVRVATRIRSTPGIAEDLRSGGMWHPAALFAAYVGGGDAVAPLVAGAQRHTDDRPLLEFSTPRSLYVDTMPLVAAALDRLRSTPFPRMTRFDAGRVLDADATYLFGFAYASLEDPTRAIPYMERSTRMAPDRPAYLVGLGNQYREVGRARAAEAAYRRALRLDPKHLDAILTLGEFLADAGEAAEARALAETALRLDPADERAKALHLRARGKTPP